MNPTQKAILDRRSIRDYAATQLTKEQLSALIEAAFAAPSANNKQPWHFTVVQDSALIDRVHAAASAEILKDPANASPRFADPAFHIFYHAPTAIFITADSTNNPGAGALDCGIAVENIALSAEGLGLGSVILGLPGPAFTGDEGDSIRAALGLPEGYNFRIAIAIGTATASKEAHPIGEGKVNYVR